MKNLIHVLNSVLLGALAFLFLSLPLSVIGACETEHSTLQSCLTNLSHCLYCEEHPGVMGCNGNECDGVTTINGCGDEQFLYDSCVAAQNNQGGNNGQGNNQGGDGGEQELLCDCNGEILPNDTCYSQCNLQCEQPQECTNDGEIWSTGQCKCVCNSDEKCCGIQLNTVVPFIGDCIELDTDSSRGDTTSVNSVTAFPVLMQGLMKILMSAIMIFSFLMVIIAGLLMTTAGFGGNAGFTKGKTILKNVIISLILLGCSGLILSLINPNFFGG